MPWSGFYEVTSPTWAVAHTTQFSQVGWRYLQQGSGVGFLHLGGSYTTRVSPDGKDFSIVVEKMTQEDSKCARGSNPSYGAFVCDWCVQPPASWLCLPSPQTRRVRL